MESIYLSSEDLISMMPKTKIFGISDVCLWCSPCIHGIKIISNDNVIYRGELDSREVRKILRKYPHIHDQCSIRMLMHIFDLEN